jgi:membrane-associated protease RseP (regulator of RpoE activity)
MAGLKAGDIVVAVDGHHNISEEALRDYTSTRIGRPLTIVVDRKGELVTVHATPQAALVNNQRVGRLGLILTVGPVLARHRSNAISAIGQGATQTWDLSKAVIGQLGNVFGPSGLKRIWQLLTGAQQRSDRDVGSVVAGGRLVVQAANAHAWDALLYILVSVNVFIGILNLVPLPPLDGGHLAVILYEKVRRRRPDVRKLVPLTAVVAAFMILFAFAITYLDIVQPLPNPFR